MIILRMNNLIVLAFIGLLVTVFTTAPNYKSSKSLTKYFPSCTTVIANSYAQDSDGNFALTVTCMKSTTQLDFLIAVAADGTVKFNKTYVAYSTYPYNLWVSGGAVYTCGVGVDSALPTFLSIEGMLMSGARKWLVTPHKISGIEETAKCFWETTTLTYITNDANGYRIGYINVADGSIGSDAAVSTPTSYTIDSGLRVGDDLKVSGRGVDTNAETFTVTTPFVYLADYSFATRKISGHVKYDFAPNPTVSNYKSNDDVALFAFGKDLVLQYDLQLNADDTYVNVLRKVAVDGAEINVNSVNSFFSTDEEVISFEQYIVMNYFKSNTEKVLAFFDGDLHIVQEYALPYDSNKYNFYNILGVISRSAVIAIGQTSEVRVYWVDHFADCPEKYTPDENYNCVPCDISCKTCAIANNAQGCTDCSFGLSPFDPSSPVFNCTFYGSDESTVQCIDDFVQASAPLVTLSSWVRSYDAGFYFNFNSFPFQCTGLAFNASLTESIDITKYLGVRNSTTISISIPLNMINDSTCSSTINGPTKSRHCNIYLYLTGAATGVKAAGFKIDFQIDYNIDSTIVTSSVILGSYTLYEEHTTANGTALVSVESKICSDETCTSFDSKQTYTQGETLYIRHTPTTNAASIDSVSDLVVNFTKDGTSKKAMDYLLNQQNNADGSLTTKLQLLDSSNKPIIVTFYLKAKFKATRRLLAETKPTNGLGKSEFTFTVLPKEGVDEKACSDSVFGCYETAWISGIICAIAFVLLGIAVVAYYRCTKKQPLAAASSTESTRGLGKPVQLVDEKEMAMKMP